MTDQMEAAAIAAAMEGRIAAQKLQEAFARKVMEGRDRYDVDAEFHARVYQVARVIDDDVDFTVLAGLAKDWGGDIVGWEMALGLALKATVALEETQPGGLLAVAP